jgi:putative DNA primase/helicase
MIDPLTAIPATPEQQAAYAEQSTESMQETIARLAKLHPLEYDKVRQSEADKLGISRVTELDKQVSKARKQIVDNNAPFPDIEPWPEPVNPVLLLDEISATIRRFIAMDKYQADIAALWIAVCWFVDVVYTAAIALINAPERACGKTQLLTLLGKLAPRATQLSGISPSVLFRMIEKYQPTLFVDEIETVLRDNEELRGLFNAGHTRDSAFVWRVDTSTDDFEPKRFSVWGMKAIAGINAVKLAETVTSRSIIFELRRKKPDEHVERLRHAEPLLFERLTAQLARFADDYSEKIRQIRPILPDTLGDRDQDNIEPLLQVAYIAGGHWPDAATKAALKIFKASQGSQSTANELLADIQEIFETKHISKISTADLIKFLIEDEEKSWLTYNRGKQLTPKQLAGKLRDYGIYSKTIRIGYETAKGYELDQFTDVFERYLSQHPPFLPSQSNISMKANTSNDFRVTDDVTDENAKGNNVTNVTDTEKCDGTLKRKVTPEPASIKDCDVVTDRTPLSDKCVRI